MFGSGFRAFSSQLESWLNLSAHLFVGFLFFSLGDLDMGPRVMVQIPPWILGLYAICDARFFYLHVVEIRIVEKHYKMYLM